MIHRLIIVGSPRVNGRSAMLADELFNACIDECPDDIVSILSVASLDVSPCTGCGACADPVSGASGPSAGCAAEAATSMAGGAEGAEAEKDPLLAPVWQVEESDCRLHCCVIPDDMARVRMHMDAADELIVVCPLYFAGAPAQMKALMDRLQPYFCSTVRKLQKRPMALHIVGEGGDPHGFDPLVTTMQSAFACAGFRLGRIFDWVGRISADGEIIADAEEYGVVPAGASGAPDEPVETPVESVEAPGSAGFEGDEAEGDAACTAGSRRATLDLSSAGKGPRKAGDSPKRASQGKRGPHASEGSKGARKKAASHGSREPHAKKGKRRG